MAKRKRGKLRHVEVRPMYDEKGKTSGYTVHAHHDAAEDSTKNDIGGGYVPPIETPHENMDSAVAKVKQHLSGAQEPDYDDGDDEAKKPMRKAFGRPSSKY